MTPYKPDKWCIIRIGDKGTSNCIYKIVAGWDAGPSGEDLWRMNSGIVFFREGDGVVKFVGFSSSVYECAIGLEGVDNASAQTMFPLLQERNVETITYEDFKKEWSEWQQMNMSSELRDRVWFKKILFLVAQR